MEFVFILLRKSQFTFDLSAKDVFAFGLQKEDENQKACFKYFSEKKKISFCNFTQENRGLLCFLSCLQPEPS